MHVLYVDTGILNHKTTVYFPVHKMSSSGLYGRPMIEVVVTLMQKLGLSKHVC